MTILFISDLHLSPTTPEINDCFIRFLRQEASRANALYILGDLFEFWIGDDDKSEFSTLIQSELKALTDSGVPCYFTQGNRDFLVGKRFSKQTGVQLLADETVVDLYGKKTVILHGDTLCTQDVNYLEYRAKVHQPWLQWVFNHIPMFIKKKIVSRVQSDIQTVKQSKSLDIMDVTQSEVEKVMSEQNVTLMIHGHTHRPKIHTFTLGQRNYTRIVLGDWYNQGSVLIYTESGFELQQRPFVD